jgi:uncharacterized membrane protein
MKKNITTIAAFVIWVLPILYFIQTYTALPETVALHFDINGNPNRYGNKSELIWAQIILSITTIGIYFLLRYLPTIDPKKNVSYSADTLKKLSIILVVFLSALQLVVINSAVTGSFKLTKFFLPIVGLFFALLGNLMHNMKPNYFFGIRTPWTLEDENNWRATHQLAGKLWFVGGIIITIIALLIPKEYSFKIFIACVIIMALVPSVYSFLYFKKHKNKN